MAQGRKGSPADIHVEIDILPGEPFNVVDADANEALRVAILGSPAFDARTVVPESVTLAGAPSVKDDEGSDATVEDVNGDGWSDMIVQFAPRQMQLSEGDTHAVLIGKTVRGGLITGRDSFRTLGSALNALRDSRQRNATAHSSAHSEEKLPPIDVSIEVLPGDGSDGSSRDARGRLPGTTGGLPARGPSAPGYVVGALPVAILGSENLNVREVDPASIRLNGSPITRTSSGEVASYRDMNADGREDLVVAISSRILRAPVSRATAPAPLRPAGQTRGSSAPITSGMPDLQSGSIEATLRASTFEGRILEGVGFIAISSVAVGSAAIGPASLSSASGPTRAVGHSTVDYPALDDRTGNPPAVDAPTVSIPAVGASAAGEPTVSASAFSATTASTFDAAGSPSDPGETQSLAGDGTGKPPESGAEFTNPSAIFINDNTQASPYPSTLSVSGLSGVISKVTVTLNRVTHTCLDDLDILLVGPSGQSLVLMSDVGACHPGVTDLTLTLDDNAGNSLTSSLIPASSRYKPTNESTAGEPAGDTFPSPAPAPSGAIRLNAFAGTDPNGPWKLFVKDDAAADTGMIGGGWTLNFVTAVQICNPTPMTIPGGPPGTTSGPAEPYGTAILVSGLSGQVVSKVSVSLNGLSHTFPDDLDVLLVGPGQQKVMLMSDAGGSSGISNLALSFDDDAPAVLPDNTAIAASQTFRPTDYEPGDSLPAPAPAGPYGTSLGTFRGMDPNAAWYLYIADDGLADVGSLSGGWCLTITTVAPVQSCNIRNLTIPAGAPGTTSGPATPYPSNIIVAGANGVVSKATVKLSGLSHTFPDDLDILLVAPSGQKIMLMSDAGGDTDVTNLQITFDQGAPAPVPDASALVSGAYKTADYVPGENLPAPAPAGPYSATLADLFEADANGTWSLYVADDTGSDVGSLSGGWCLTLTLALEPYVRCQTEPITIPAAVTGATSGPAGPYPSTITVSGLYAPLGKVRVALSWLSHTNPDDLDILLVGPQGQTVMLMSDAGGATDAVNVDLLFDEDATASPPDAGALQSGVYKPVDYEGGADPFPAPAPPGGYYDTLTDFKGKDPNGTWSLYIVDDATNSVGSLAGGWCLELTPQLPPGEVTHLRFVGPGKTTLAWDAATNVEAYHVFRGTPASLPALLDETGDSCRAAATVAQTFANFSRVPQPGSFYWYLVLGVGYAGYGSAGQARIGTAETARVLNGTTPCTP